MCNNIDKSEYEGAGFLLIHKQEYIMGIRIKKLEDVAKDPTVEVEYIGGKREKEDNNDPLVTAINELFEELGTPLVWDQPIKDRVEQVSVFQPISKKWIHCYNIELTDNEYEQIVEIDKLHDSWDPAICRDLSDITKRPGTIRKAIRAFVSLPMQDLYDYVQGMPPRDDRNRMTVAKEYRFTAPPLKVTRLSTGELFSHPLRAFNTVLFEEQIRNAMTAVHH